ncbi:MAG: uroporphyrinogen decarboxylase/cobalamine-independent methonine synthase family protein [Desulfobaccales bacterium]
MSPLSPLAATGIGSVPFLDAGAAAATILEYLPEVPFWPQMVRLGFPEEMVAQAARGLPGLKIDLEARTVAMDPHLPREEALASLYEQVWAGDLDPFALDPSEAQGFFALLRDCGSSKCQARVLKGQVSGPVTFAGMVKDLEGKAILYDRELTQAVCQGLALKAAWQAQKFRDLGKEAVIFLDEPFLTGFGSAYLPISKDEVVEILTETLNAVRVPGPVTLGVHCCGNTDWSLLLESPLDILSFDAYGYFDSLRLYDKALQGFFARGGWLAWGLVPTGEDLHEETADSLWGRFQGQVQQLALQGPTLKEILSQSLLTPACGMGYLTPEAATRVLALLADLSARGRNWLAALK